VDEPDQLPESAGSNAGIDPEAQELPPPSQLDFDASELPVSMTGEGDGESSTDRSEEPEPDMEAPSQVDEEAVPEMEGDPELSVNPSEEAEREGGPDTEEIEIPEIPLTQRVQPPIEAPSPVWIWWGWSMVGLFSLVVVVGVVTGILGRAVLLDIVSFWPVFGLLTLVAIAVRSRFSHRIRALLPLLIATWLGAAVALHLSGWSVLPSAVGDMAGAEIGEIANATLSLEIDGIVNLESSPGSILYSVVLPREGGRVSAPQALETTNDDLMSIELAQRNESFWFSSSGWNIVVSDDVVWTLHLVASEVDIDLRSTATNGGVLRGTGTLQFGTSAAGEWDIAGQLVIRVPDALGILVVGDADLPTGWTVTEVGRQWGDTVVLTLVVAEGSAVEIVTY